MIGIVISASLAVFFFVFWMLYLTGQRIDQKDDRIRFIKTGRRQTEEEKKSKLAFSFDSFKEKMVSKRKTKLIGQQISGMKNADKLSEAERLLLVADVPLTGTQFLIVKMGLAIVLVVLAFVICLKLQVESRFLLLAVAFGGCLGIILPGRWLTNKVKKRQENFRNTLPDMMDLLVVSVEAGMGFDAAIIRLYEKDSTPIVSEMMRTIQDVRRGMSKKEAYANMAERCGVKEVTSFLNAMVQADTLGISIKSVLTAQAEALRESRRQRAEEQALKAPVKMLIPMVIFIFPVIFIILLGPAILNIIEMGIF